VGVAHTGDDKTDHVVVLIEMALHFRVEDADPTQSHERPSQVRSDDSRAHLLKALPAGGPMGRGLDRSEAGRASTT
jgi:hypothetical protein